MLFDELGAGTDPGEGAALAVSISEYVMSTGAKSLVTSHFNDLKEFALTTRGVVAASMEFDSVTFRPTFKLVMGAIGTSNALDIATTLGLDAKIVENARGRISAEKRQFDSVLSAAEQTRRRAEQLVSDASLDRERAASALREAENQKKLIAEKREKLDESIRRETKHLIENSVEEADEILERLREMLDKEVVEDKDIFAARALKRRLQNMSAEYDKESVVEDEPDDTPLRRGDSVWVRSLAKRGTYLGLSMALVMVLPQRSARGPDTRHCLPAYGAGAHSRCNIFQLFRVYCRGGADCARSVAHAEVLFHGKGVRVRVYGEKARDFAHKHRGKRQKNAGNRLFRRQIVHPFLRYSHTRRFRRGGRFAFARRKGAGVCRGRR